MNKNIENVLTTLDSFRTNDEMTYSAYSTLHDEISLLDDLLKEQESKPVRIKTNAYGTKHYYCPKCNEWFEKKEPYCHLCGQAVKWE